MAEYEYITDIQRDLNWGETFNMSIKAPITSKRRFLTLGEAQAFVDDTYNSATPGLVITVLSDYVKDAEATYEEGHFVCVTDAFTNFTWETAVGRSEGDTYTPGPEGTDNTGAYYIKSVGDDTNPGELVKIGGSGGSGEIIRKYQTLQDAHEDEGNFSNSDLFVVYETEDKGLYYVVKLPIETPEWAPINNGFPLETQDGENEENSENEGNGENGTDGNELNGEETGNGNDNGNVPDDGHGEINGGENGNLDNGGESGNTTTGPSGANDESGESGGNENTGNGEGYGEFNGNGNLAQEYLTYFIKIASVEDPEIQRFDNLEDATTYALTAEDGILVSLMIENDPNGDSGIYYTYNGTLIKLGGCPHVNTAFELKSQADEFATTASLGTIVCVYGDPNSSYNGVYYVAEGDDGNVLIKVGGGGSNNFTESPIKVRGVNIGEYNTGDTIPQGTLFEDIFNDMLHKTVDVNLVLPKALCETDIPVPEYVEVGSVLDLSLILSFVDGYFESEDKEIYPDDEFEELNPNAVDGKLIAYIPPQVPLEYFYVLDEDSPPPGSGMQNNRVPISLWCREEASHVLKGTISHTISQVIAKMNNGESSTKRLNDGFVLSEPFNFKAVYKGFYGYTHTRAAQDYGNVFTDQTSLSNLETIWLDDEKDIYAGVKDEDSGEWIMKSTDNASTLVIALPEYFEIVETKNSQGAYIPLIKWQKLGNTITYTTSYSGQEYPITTQYNVYVMHNTQGIYYKQIKIERKINN